MSLSDRFTKLHQAAPVGNANRKFATFNKQKNERSSGMNAKRGLVGKLNAKQQNTLNKKNVQNNRVASHAKGNKLLAKAKVGGTPSKKRPSSAKSAAKVKSPATKTAAAKKAAATAKKPPAKKPTTAAVPKPTAEDLNMEMDKYWFSVGKGPDPMQAKLDREMDAYQSARAATASAAATVDVNATAVAAPAAESMEA